MVGVHESKTSSQTLGIYLQEMKAMFSNNSNNFQNGKPLVIVMSQHLIRGAYDAR